MSHITRTYLFEIITRTKWKLEEVYSLDERGQMTWRKRGIHEQIKKGFKTSAFGKPPQVILELCNILRQLHTLNLCSNEDNEAQNIG